MLVDPHDVGLALDAHRPSFTIQLSFFRDRLSTPARRAASRGAYKDGSGRPAALAHGVRRREPAVDHDRLAVDVGAVVRGEEQRRAGDLLRLAAPLQRVEVADPVLRAPLAGPHIEATGHAGLDQAWTDRIDPHAR